MKILIIEDDKELAKAMKFQLEKEDFSVNCVTTEKKVFIICRKKAMTL